MKKNEDIKIQEFLDQKLKEKEILISEMVDTKDLETYKLLYNHLKEKPVQELSFSFKPNVLRRIEIEKKQASDIKLYWLLGIIFLVGIIVISSMFLVFKDTFTSPLGVIGKYKGFIVVGLYAYILFSIVERKAIKNGRQF